MTTQRIPQQYVGRLNVVGDCFVFGAALHDNVPVYLDMAGPATSVEAVWAKLAQGKEARIVPDEGASIVLQPPEAGLYTRYQRKLEGLAIDHLLLVHKAITEPVYNELTLTYLIFTDKAQATAILGDHIARLVKVAVFPEWHPYLVQQGRLKRLMQRCTCYGGVDVWCIALNETAWTQVIQAGLATQSIQLPPVSATADEAPDSATDKPLFALGQLVTTPGALDALVAAGLNPADLISRHEKGDWGDLETADKAENDRSVKRQLRILSAYDITPEVKVWVITEADRSTTTLLLPGEY